MKKHYAVLAIIILGLPSAVLSDDRQRRVERVFVVNGESRPIPVVATQPERQAFTKTVSGTFSGPFGTADIVSELEIPTDRTLVVEAISWFINVPGNEKALFVELEYNTGASSGFIYPELSMPQVQDDDPLNTRNFYTRNEAVTLYLTNASSLGFRVQKQQVVSNSFPGSFVVTVTGYLD